MDVVVAGDAPRVIDYKYAKWREGVELAHEIQLTAYCLALMKSLETERAVGELWYLKNPMKIVRREYRREAAEHRLTNLMEQYIRAVETDTWSPAERSYCDLVKCGFRERCWMTTPEAVTTG
jgi:CRISPR/Cas system-associated exonuclease Cas4 (RecB family)